MDSVSDLAAELLNIALIITVAGAGVTAALAFVMGVITAVRALGRTDQERSLKSAAVMFLIVSADCFVLWALSDFWGNDEPVAAVTAAGGFGLLALALYRISVDRRQGLMTSSTGQADATDADVSREETTREDDDG